MFKEHLGALLNLPHDPSVQHPEVQDSTYMPITDDSITPGKVLDTVNDLKMNKSGGPPYMECSSFVYCST